MSEELTLLESSEEDPIACSEAWLSALTRPYLFSYESLAKNSSISTEKAYIWIIVGGIVVGFGDVAYRFSLLKN